MKRFLATLMLLAGTAGAIDVNLRPQGKVLTEAVNAAIKQLSTRSAPVRLNTKQGTTITLGGVGVTAAPFNPDVAARVVVVGNNRRIEINPKSPIPLKQTIKAELMKELKLKAWTPTEAQRRFSSADLNGDNVVNLADLAVLMENLGKNTGYGDLNQDRKVDNADVRLFMAQYAKSDILAPSPSDAQSPAPTATPTAPNPNQKADPNTRPAGREKKPRNSTPTERPPSREKSKDRNN